MQDYIRRFLIAVIMALCVSLLFLGGKHSQAEMLNIPEQTSHWIWPAEGVITDLYGTRHGHHKGIDIAAGLKSKICTVDDGIVTKSYYSDSYGNVVFIKHPNQLETVYAHLNSRSVEEGQKVKQGEMIGEMGNTGDSSGVHLHFEIHVGEWTYEKENAINPKLALGEAKIGQPVVALNENGNEGAKGELGKKLVREDEKLDPKKAIEVSTISEEIHPQQVYEVEKGDTLWSIAKKYHSTVALIAEENQLNSEEIQPGKEIIIPTNRESKYIVSSGETLYSISIKVNRSVQELKALNKLTSDIIHPQQILSTE